jgi:glycosyltransferase involved in cell wall biosynthesis
MAHERMDSPSTPTVSAIVVCFNEEDRIRDCLECLRWCDEIIVVDSFSTDQTPDICRRYTDRFMQREWLGYKDQKTFAYSQATKEWVLSVDADEHVTADLRDEIRSALAGDGGKYNGYSIPRLVYYLGRWWWRGGWYPDYNVRLFRRNRAVWGGVEPHDKILVDGKVRRLRYPLHHFSYRGMHDHVRKINQFTSISSRELRKQDERWHTSAALLRPAARFLYSYLWKRGFMDGFAGFYVAVTASVYVFLKYAKLWELELEEKRKLERKR